MILLDDLLQATGGRQHGPAHAERFSGFAYDSRIIEPSQLFCAVVTDTGDGHAHITQAVANGATGVLCERAPVDELAATVITVGSTQQALLDYAAYILASRRVQVVGVTGSVGKTSAKEAIAAVLGVREPVFRNPGSYNGRFGLPIALGALEPGQHLAVLEMASDSLDEIARLAETARPQVGVVTAVAQSHLDVFGSLEAVAREKARLVEALPAEGLAVLNADDLRVAAMAARTRARVVTFGVLAAADYRASAARVAPDGTRLTVWAEGEKQELFIPLVGAHHAYTALAAAAVGRAFGLEWDDIAWGLAGVQPLPGRTRWLPALNGAHLLDDSYNANPASSQVALEALQALPAQRRIVVLGDMDALGAWAAEGHRQAGVACARVADLLVTKGELARLAAEAALAAGMAPECVRVTYSAADAAELVRAELRMGDLVLVKGGAAARMEEVTAGLLADPATARDVLPRQHSGWRQVRLQHPGRPTWVEIDLQAVAQNTRRLRAMIDPGVELLAVLKADAYGHGAIKVARTVLQHGATWLGVACLGEAEALRREGIEAPILALGYTPPWQAREAVLNDVRVTLFSREVAAALSRAAVDLQRPARVHVKVDTGMGRLGLAPEETTAFLREVAALPGVQVEGLFSHFSSADEEELDYTRGQYERFRALLEELAAARLRPRLAHLANSAGALRLPEARLDMVRVGIALYGLNPSPQAPLPEGFASALKLKCQVAQVKELSAGSAVGYGRTFVAPGPMRVAVIPVGYADGFRRGPRTWGEVLVRGRRAPIVGRVSMDQTTLDVTAIPGVAPGDEVVLIGEQGDERITVDEVAERLGTIGYEVVSEILARVPRVV